ncbi:MAG: hypothetical protein ABUS47_04205 [Steroidobacter sp.]
MTKRTAQHCLRVTALGLLFFIAVSHIHAMTFIESHAVHITTQEQQLLELKACRDKFNTGTERIVARTDASSTPDVYAEVLCQSHEQFKHSPVYHVVYCDRNADTWHCERTERAIRTDGNRALVYYAEDVDTAIAYAIIVKLASIKRFQGEAMPDMQKSVCNIQRFATFDNTSLPDVFTVTCENREILVSTWCPQQECPRIIGSRIIVLNLSTDAIHAFHAALYASPNFRILPSNAA